MTSENEGLTVPNLNDVAKIAGVSPITVSRVLNNKGPIAEQTRAKVLAAVEATGYFPNLLGRNLKMARTKTILVVFSMVMPHLFDGIIETAAKLGYDVSFSYLNAHQNRLASIKSLESNLVDGVILIGHVFSDEELQALSRRYHIVQLADYSDFEEICSVSINDEKAAYDITSLLIEKGYRKLGSIAAGKEQDRLQFSDLRKKGFLRALAENDLACDPEMQFCRGDFHSLEAIIDRMTSQTSLPVDAMVCFTDVFAADLIRALHTKSIGVPQDIAVTGFDDLEIAGLFVPSITTVAQPFFEMSVEATKLLIDQLQGTIESSRKIYINHKIILRESTK
jgi:LacI family transcriptional regulator, repressor for deo operon, udp, cdd, tsx, nupC, and nupG